MIAIDLLLLLLWKVQTQYGKTVNFNPFRRPLVVTHDDVSLLERASSTSTSSTSEADGRRHHHYSLSGSRVRDPTDIQLVIIKPPRNPRPSRRNRHFISRRQFAMTKDVRGSREDFDDGRAR